MPWCSASRRAISACAASSAARKATWCTEPPPMPPGRKPSATRIIHRAAEPPVRLEAHEIALPARLGEAEHVCEDGAGRRRVLKHQGDAREAADGVLGRDAAAAPGRLAFG